jgi:hypothetical protein
VSHDHGTGSDALSISVGTGLLETGRNRTDFRIEKWDIDQIRYALRKLDLDAPPSFEPRAEHFRRLGIRPFEVREWENCNLITNAGWVVYMHGIMGTSISPLPFSASVGRIGLGTVALSTAMNATDTALGSISGITGNNWSLCGAAPTVGATGAAGMVFTATFSTTQANGTLTEFAIDAGTAAAGPTVTATAPMINHSIQTTGAGAYGTKTSAQTWNATATLTFT